MRSKTSFFDIRYAKLLLRRFWPLWLLWFAALLLVGPLGLSGNYRDEQPIRFLSALRGDLISSAAGAVWLSFVMGALMAMGMLSHLYFPRTCALVNSLPLRRETVYFTAVLTGLVPMLLCDALVCGILWASYGSSGAGARYFLWWLEMALLSNAGFYGFACFCGTLTGNVLVLPAVYVVLSCAVGLFEAAVRQVFRVLLYGYAYSTLLLERLSPPLWLTEHSEKKILVATDAEKGIAAEFEPTYLSYTVGLCAAGLVFLLLGALIIRKRHMETVGEVVAVPVLRPIFRLCMSLGCGLLGSAALVEAFLPQLRGTARFVALAVGLCIFAALGWFAAEMLIQKTLRVFDHGWKKIGVICACLLVFAVLTELDVTGYEKRVPAVSEIASIDMPYRMDGGVTDSRSLEAFVDFQRGIIAHKAENEAYGDGQVYYLSLNYHLKNGTLYQRFYRIPEDDAHLNDPDSDIAAWERLNNLEAVRLQRVWADDPLRPEEIRDAWVEVRTPLGDNRYTSNNFVLSPEQAVSLHREGIVPDAEAGNIARWVVRASDETRAERTNLTVTIMRTVRRDTGAGNEYYYISLDEAVLYSSENTLRWLKDNLDLEPTAE